MNVSDETAKKIDKEIRRIVDQGYDRAKNLLKEHSDELEKLAQALLEYETLTGDEIRQLLEDGKIDRPDVPKGPVIAQPSHGSLVPKAGKRFSGEGEGGAAPQGA